MATVKRLTVEQMVPSVHDEGSPFEDDLSGHAAEAAAIVLAANWQAALSRGGVERIDFRRMTISDLCETRRQLERWSTWLSEKLRVEFVEERT